MSTRSMIAFEDADGHFYATYCHFDGYIQHMGRVLVENFNSSEGAVEIVNHGFLSSIDVKDDGSIVFDVSDWDIIEYYDSLDDMVQAFYESDREYLYLWDDESESWIYRMTHYGERTKIITSHWVKVSKALERFN